MTAHHRRARRQVVAIVLLSWMLHMAQYNQRLFLIGAESKLAQAVPYDEITTKA